MGQGFEEIARAYEGLEERFADRAELEAYRAAMLDRSAAQAALIDARLPATGPLLEIGAGNGRLLVALAALGHGDALGIELSRSRTAFARAWAEELGLAGVRVETGDALQAELPPGRFAAALCITGALGYFAPATPDGDRRLLEQLRDALAPGGLLVLELYPHAEDRRILAAAGGALRRWSELPEPDPWRFYLSDLELDGDSAVLTHRKTFIARDGGAIDAGRVERLRLFDPDSLRALLAAVGGFSAPELLADWDGGPYDGGDVLVALARRERT
jgi:SAM-dependent methyltransferase